MTAASILTIATVRAGGQELAAASAAQSKQYAMLVQGASGEPQYATLHRGWLDSIVTVLRDKFHYDQARLVVLAEQPKAGEERSTAESVREALGRLSKTLTPADQLVIVFIGHGGGEGADAKFNLIGPDLTVGQWAELLKPVPGRLAVVDTTSASFPYLAGLSAPGRVIITATSSFAQRYHTVFPEGFVRALTSPEADADKNGRISLLEAFEFATRWVKQHYEENPKELMQTEMAALDDNGDGKGRQAATEGPDGSVAALTYLDTAVAPTSSDPETQRLLTRQQELTNQIDDLRRRRSAMPDAEFEREFERLMLDLSKVSSEVRKRTGR
jgi:hypothetical protein